MDSRVAQRAEHIQQQVSDSDTCDGRSEDEDAGGSTGKIEDNVSTALTGNRTILRQTNSRSVKSRTGQLATSQLAEMFDGKFGVFSRVMYDFH